MIYTAFHFLYDKLWICFHIYESSMRAYIYPLYKKEDIVSTPFLVVASGATRVSSIFILGTIPPLNVEIDSYKGRIIMTFDFIYGKKDKSFVSGALRYSS